MKLHSRRLFNYSDLNELFDITVKFYKFHHLILSLHLQSDCAINRCNHYCAAIVQCIAQISLHRRDDLSNEQGRIETCECSLFCRNFCTFIHNMKYFWPNDYKQWSR